jgi:hypothetical protein
MNVFESARSGLYDVTSCIVAPQRCFPYVFCLRGKGLPLREAI